MPQLVSCSQYVWGPMNETIVLGIAQDPASPGNWVVTHNVALPNSWANIFFCGLQGTHMPLMANGTSLAGLPIGVVEAQIIITNIYSEAVAVSNVVKFVNNGSPVPPSPPFFSPYSEATYGEGGGQAGLLMSRQVNQEFEAAAPLTLQVFKNLESSPFFSVSLTPGNFFVPLRLPAVGQARSIQVRISSASVRCPVSISRIEFTIEKERRAGQ